MDVIMLSISEPATGIVAVSAENKLSTLADAHRK